MNGRGRPLRFLALVTAGWAGARVMMLWPEGATLPEAIEAVLPVHPAEAAINPPAPAARSMRRERRAVATRPIVGREPAARGGRATPEVGPTGHRAAASLAVMQDAPLGAPPGAIPSASISPDVPSDNMTTPSRWSASAWFVTRRGTPASGAMLGGDQTGVRVAYALDARQRVRAYVRATAPLAMAGREVTAGIEWQPTRLPVRLVAERRMMLDGGSGGPAVGVLGGVSAVELPFAFSLEAYAQAGAVFRERTDGFADGAVRATREVGDLGGMRLQIGAGAWAAAQREATRVDIGPSVVATMPIGARAVRVALDWRERIGGDARPGSGPALSIGADF